MLKLPEQAPPKRRRKPGFKSVTITDTSFLTELEEKEEDKKAKEEEKQRRKEERKKELKQTERTGTREET